MPRNGWIKLHRCLTDSEVWRRGNRYDLKIWLWLLLAAGPGGEVRHSLRFIGNGVGGLAPSLVKRTLDRLERYGMIRQHKCDAKRVTGKVTEKVTPTTRLSIVQWGT